MSWYVDELLLVVEGKKLVKGSNVAMDTVHGVGEWQVGSSA